MSFIFSAVILLCLLLLRLLPISPFLLPCVRYPVCISVFWCDLALTENRFKPLLLY